MCAVAGMHKRPQLLTVAAQAVHEALTPAGTCHHMLSTQEQSLQLVVKLSFDLVQADDTTKLAMCACIARLVCLDAQIRGEFTDSVLYPTATKASLFPTWRQLVLTFIQVGFCLLLREVWCTLGLRLLLHDLWSRLGLGLVLHEL